MASFVCDMVNRPLAYKTIRGYTWAVAEHHVQNGYMTPLVNVWDWSHFMHGVEVQLGDTPGHKKMVPFKILAAGMGYLWRQHSGNRHWVMVGLLVVITLLSMCRGGEPLPDAKNGFDKKRHTQRKHVRVH